MPGTTILLLLVMIELVLVDIMMLTAEKKTMNNNGNPRKNFVSQQPFLRYQETIESTLLAKFTFRNGKIFVSCVVLHMPKHFFV